MYLFLRWYWDLWYEVQDSSPHFTGAQLWRRRRQLDGMYQPRCLIPGVWAGPEKLHLEQASRRCWCHCTRT